MEHLIRGRMIRLDRSRLRTAQDPKNAKDVVPGDMVALTRANHSDLLALAVVTEHFQLQPRTVLIPAAGG
jgi:hypothetical protein